MDEAANFGRNFARVLQRMCRAAAVTDELEVAP